MTHFIAWLVGDLMGIGSAWFLAHRAGYRKGYRDALAACIPAQREGER